jgi:hypothetical protein
MPPSGAGHTLYLRKAFCGDQLYTLEKSRIKFSLLSLRVDMAELALQIKAQMMSLVELRQCGSNWSMLI